MNKNNLKIDNKIIGEDYPAFIIAELSCNHLQDLSLALKTIDKMKESGVDAVKIQTLKPENITLKSDKDYFQIKQGTLWDGKTLFDLYTEVYTPWEWHKKLKEHAESQGLIFFSSPFDITAVDFLEELETPAYKIASFEITDIQLIKHVASKGKPVIISTGIAKLADIELAVETCRKENNHQIVLMKCTSAYPSPLEEMNLKTIKNISETFNVITGLSDHSPGQIAAITAVALGAKIIEKHFILDRQLGGPDAAFSMEPDEFKLMVQLIRDAEKSLGKITYELSDSVRKSREFCRSLFVVEDIKKGDPYTDKNVKSIRPGFGLMPKHLNYIIGKKASNNLEKGTPLTWEMIDS